MCVLPENKAKKTVSVFWLWSHQDCSFQIFVCYRFGNSKPVSVSGGQDVAQGWLSVVALKSFSSWRSQQKLLKLVCHHLYVCIKQWKLKITILCII